MRVVPRQGDRVYKEKQREGGQFHSSHGVAPKDGSWKTDNAYSTQFETDSVPSVAVLPSSPVQTRGSRGEGLRHAGSHIIPIGVCAISPPSSERIAWPGFVDFFFRRPIVRTGSSRISTLFRTALAEPDLRFGPAFRFRPVDLTRGQLGLVESDTRGSRYHHIPDPKHTHSPEDCWSKTLVPSPYILLCIVPPGRKLVELLFPSG
ncbi:hypothetical protein OF83DRAFT_519265 [Amylostereum chailletii]|nr:hypothetical protein OF83DRAFT_519265 [Amylostereum chailletii]